MSEQRRLAAIPTSANPRDRLAFSKAEEARGE